MTEVIYETNLPNLISRGKVRDSYDLGDRMLIVATDRISAFDVIMKQPIPRKGEVLSKLSEFWFEKTAHLMPNHLIETVEDVSMLSKYFDNPPSYLAGRSMIVKKAKVIDIECVVRGYIAGSAWSDYSKTGIVNGIPLAPGLVEAAPLVEPMFTPTTKATSGHDEPLTIKEMVNLVGAELTRELIKYSVSVYTYAEEYARDLGIIIADTKFEFGIIDDKIILVDEVLTPDSSRFWEMSAYEPGHSQPSYDKQPVRDWLADSGWNKEPPPPDLPDDVVQKTTERYLKAYRRLTGKDL
ncbi:phosphoribosylaminoimidazolesuccinocarboxamide synthase [Chloroflexota bacterium]